MRGSVQVVARDVAYELIPFMQRRHLHAKLAEALAKSGDTVPAATVAYHWAQSCKASNGKGLDPGESPRLLQVIPLLPGLSYNNLQVLKCSECPGASNLHPVFVALPVSHLRLGASDVLHTFHSVSAALSEPRSS